MKKTTNKLANTGAESLKKPHQIVICTTIIILLLVQCQTKY